MDDKVKIAIKALTYFATENNYKRIYGQEPWVMQEGQYYAHNCLKILLGNPKPETKEYEEFVKLTKMKRGCPFLNAYADTAV